MASDTEQSKLLGDAPTSKDVGGVGARRCASLCVAILTLWAALSVAMGFLAGYSFTKLCYGPFTGLEGILHALGFLCKDGQIAPQLSQCDKFFCGAGDGPMYTPANVTQSLELWVPECTSPELLEAFRNFSAAQPYSLVTFRSRPGKEGQETLDLKAWWLPAPGNDGSAPRIVIQHGNNVNFNDNTVMLTAYLLRSVGFSVLLPNHRHHGIHRIGQKIRWGYDLFLDVLGAWDYAVQDPDGFLGGPLPSSKVGVMGLSMGGLASMTALGYEPEIPAAWIDAGVFDIQDVLNFQINAALPLGPVLFLTEMLGWRFASFFAGADIGLYEPATVLKDGAQGASTSRPVQVVQGTLDEMVPSRQGEALVKELEAQGGAYNVSSLFKTYKCGGEKFPFPDHVQMHTWRPDLYRDELCRFWSSVFQTPLERCHGESLPNFPNCAAAICPSPP